MSEELTEEQKKILDGLATPDIFNQYSKVLETHVLDKMHKSTLAIKQAMYYKNSLKIVLESAWFFFIGTGIFATAYYFSHEKIVAWVAGVLGAIWLAELGVALAATYVWLFYMFYSDNTLVALKTKLDFSARSKAELLKMLDEADKLLERKHEAN